MSASPMARQAAGSKAIPIRKVVITDPSELPPHYSSTPGGTLFSTTPGGSKIVYEKAFIMNLRNSPSSKTPPSYDIPEALLKGGGSPTKNGFAKKPHQGYHYSTSHKDKHHNKVKDNHEDQFQLEL